MTIEHVIRLQEAFRSMATSDVESIRCEAAKSKHITEDLLEILSVDERYAVRFYVAGNPKTPDHILIRMKDDRESSVQQAVFNAIMKRLDEAN